MASLAAVSRIQKSYFERPIFAARFRPSDLFLCPVSKNNRLAGACGDRQTSDVLLTVFTVRGDDAHQHPVEHILSFAAVIARENGDGEVVFGND